MDAEEHTRQTYRARASALVKRVAQGTESERVSALDALHALGQESGDAEVWLAYAHGLSGAGEAGDAVKVLEWLVDIDPEPAYQIHLAEGHAALGNPHRARQILEALLSEDIPADLRAFAILRVATLGGAGHYVDPQDARVRDLQRATLRARIASGAGTPEDAIRLTALAIEHRSEDPGGDALVEAARAIEAALERAPGHVSLLEHLVLVQTLTGDARAHRTLLELERVAPDSGLLEAFVDDANLRRDAQQLRSRLGLLLTSVAEGDAARRAAALADLAMGVARFPADPDHRSTYATALMIAGCREEAIEHASVAARLAGDSHAINYNVGQVFLRAGERERAREHLSLAWEYARDDQERADADELLAQLGDG